MTDKNINAILRTIEKVDIKDMINQLKSPIKPHPTHIKKFIVNYKKYYDTAIERILKEHPAVLNRVYIDKSYRDCIDYGLGIFANVDMPARTLVSIYPCHYILLNKVPVHSVEKSEHDQPFDIATYNVGIDNNDILSISSNPNIMTPGITGHLCNDGLHTLGDTYINAELVYDSGIILVYSLCNIIRGEEIFIDYGPTYWNRHSSSIEQVVESLN